MTPPGGPYCITGRTGVVAADAAVGFGFLTAYMVASMTCGSTVIVTVPTLTMESLDGLLGSSLTTPLRFVGLVQYFSKMPSCIHFCRDRARDSLSTPLESKT